MGEEKVNEREVYLCSGEFIQTWKEVINIYRYLMREWIQGQHRFLSCV